MSSGQLVQDLPAPTAETENLDVAIISAATDILPNPALGVGVFWVDGERIEYLSKIEISPGTWELGLLRRGTNGTAPTLHTALVPEVSNPMSFVPNRVWIERTNFMPVQSNETVWQATNTLPDLTTEELPDEYTSVTAVPLGGLWYSSTNQAVFLKDGQGKAIL